ncbi:hypothetical protein [Moheibacter sediminis]|uniref:Uncharacterized protein n=1 Tax=Moheibacter sediminis TaxID=1434700 RepID=A0A1W1Z6I3_9FLAO|nr:hypothetical protein [Moheibacter sediminis]SMC44023.1 hypothetical protein SAMN06296427_102240 [Moheibacter sediminis]
MKHKFRNKKFLFIIPFFILFALTGIVMWLWNSILPEVVGVKEITYWQAMGILVLSKILFGGFHGFKKNKDLKRDQFFSKIRNMSPEEREKFKENWKNKFAKNVYCKH